MKVFKQMQKTLNNNLFINEIINSSRNLDEAYEKLGYYLSFCIATRSSKMPDNLTTYPYPASIATEKEYLKLPQSTRHKNIISCGYVTHSFNGYVFDKIKKYGLGSSKIYDQALSKDLAFLEKYFGESEYYGNQGNTENETYYTAPGAKTFHYACGLSPERLWLGILNQDRNNALPITIGETKSEYALKLINHKLEQMKNINVEEKQKILETATSVINKLCTCKPVVALIPTSPKGCTLTCNHSTTKNAKSISLTEMLKTPTGTYTPQNPETFFTENTHLIEFNNMGNLVSSNPIPAKNLTFFEVEDSFTLIQKMALKKGLETGDEIDFFTGMPYHQTKAPSICLAKQQTKRGIEKEL